MFQIIELLMNPYVQALFWGICVVFAIYFSQFVKRMSLGDDTGSKAWTVIALGLFLIGLRVSFKVIFPDYSTSYSLQITRFSLGIIGIIVLYLGFQKYSTALIRMYGEAD